MKFVDKGARERLIGIRETLKAWSPIGMLIEDVPDHARVINTLH